MDGYQGRSEEWICVATNAMQSDLKDAKAHSFRLWIRKAPAMTHGESAREA
jgi:hypothetical protein